MPIQRALVSSQSDPRLPALVSALIDIGVEVLATRAAAATIRAAGLAVTEVEALEPRVLAGLLAREKLAEGETATEPAVIDLVIVQMGPEPEPRAGDAPFDEVLASADLGGPILARIAAAAFERVTVLVDPADWNRVMYEIYQRGGDSQIETRRALALKAIASAARHEGALAELLASFDSRGGRRALPAIVSVQAEVIARLPSGDNGHQVAAFYGLYDAAKGTLPRAMLVGASPRRPSFQELLDIDTALDAIAEHELTAAVMVLRRWPVAAATGVSQEDVWRAVAAAHHGSSAGGVAAFNRPLDERAARALLETPLSVIVAPSFNLSAMDVLEARPELVLLAVREILPPGRRSQRWLQVSGGFVIEERDATAAGEVERGRIATDRQPTEAERRALAFAWLTAKHMRSDAAVLVHERPDGLLSTVGVGAGCASLDEALDIAIARAGTGARGAALACDGAILSTRVIELAGRAGITCVVQPGGAESDAQIVSAADHAAMTMIVTGVAHVRYS